LFGVAAGVGAAGRRRLVLVVQDHFFGGPSQVVLSDALLTDGQLMVLAEVVDVPQGHSCSAGVFAHLLRD